MTDAHVGLRQMYAAGEIGEDTYFRGVVDIAVQMSKEGCVDDAATMLSKLSFRYVRTVLPVQMEQDPGLRAAAGQLARVLEAAGLAIAADEEIPATLPTSSFQN